MEPTDMTGWRAALRTMSICNLWPVALLVSSSSVEAGDRVLHLDPGETSIAFSVGATLHSVDGSLALERGKIVFDTESGVADGQVVVSALSAQTGRVGRDRDMHWKVLESHQFPTMTFYPERVKGSLLEGSQSELTISGWLELHDDRHPVDWRVVATKNGSEVLAMTEFEIPYVAWGLNDPSKILLRVAKIVTVRVETIGHLGSEDQRNRR